MYAKVATATVRAVTYWRSWLHPSEWTFRVERYSECRCFQIWFGASWIGIYFDGHGD